MESKTLFTQASLEVPRSVERAPFAVDLGDVSAPSTRAWPPPAGLLELAGLLNRSSTGLGFVYELLEILTARYGLADAALVLDETPIGRQVFRLTRGSGPAGRPASWRRAVLHAGPGLHTDPAGVIDPATVAYVAGLATTALRMDLLSHDASHDALTGLLNRRSYEQAMAEAVARSKRYGWPFALVLLDLDNFKAVNDEFGHAAGDETLRLIGAEVRAVLRRGDLAARLGGDEFALIILNADSPAVLDPLQARLQGALSRAVPSAGVRFSAGVACFPDDADEITTLQRIADDRLYANKSLA